LSTGVSRSPSAIRLAEAVKVVSGMMMFLVMAAERIRDRIMDITTSIVKVLTRS